MPQHILTLTLFVFLPIVTYLTIKLTKKHFDKIKDKRLYDQDPTYRSTMLRRKDGRGVHGGMVKVEYEELARNRK